VLSASGVVQCIVRSTIIRETLMFVVNTKSRDDASPFIGGSVQRV
jgi:hypothetical protein